MIEPAKTRRFTDDAAQEWEAQFIVAAEVRVRSERIDKVPFAGICFRNLRTGETRRKRVGIGTAAMLAAPVEELRKYLIESEAY